MLDYITNLMTLVMTYSQTLPLLRLVSRAVGVNSFVETNIDSGKNKDSRESDSDNVDKHFSI